MMCHSGKGSTTVLGMRIVFEGPGKVGIEEFSLREPREGEVMIETVCTLISPGTETAFLTALPNTPGRFPMYPGYSNAGVVASTTIKAEGWGQGGLTPFPREPRDRG